MFDIGFLELTIIAVVALVVIGPERLPDAVRTTARWIARIKKIMRDTKAEVEHQIGADEIRRELHNEEIMKSLEALKITEQDINQHILDADASKTIHKPRQIESDPTLGTDTNAFTDPALAHDEDNAEEEVPDKTSTPPDEEHTDTTQLAETCDQANEKGKVNEGDKKA